VLADVFLSTYSERRGRQRLSRSSWDDADSAILVALQQIGASWIPQDCFLLTSMATSQTPKQSPTRRSFLAAHHPSDEIEALQQRLAHAQQQINTLKGSLNRKKQMTKRLESPWRSSC
jgi:TolA-binding protein